MVNLNKSLDKNNLNENVNQSDKTYNTEKRQLELKRQLVTALNHFLKIMVHHEVNC